MIKTNKRHIIPLSEPAISILRHWQEKRPDSKYVFNLVKEGLDLDNAEELYRCRNNATKCINQSLNKGLSMTVVSRLLGHGSTDITEKVYAKYLPETLAAEVARISPELKQFVPLIQK